MCKWRGVPQSGPECSIKPLLSQMRRSIGRFFGLPWEVHGLVLLLLVASQLAPLSVDSVRDVYQAHAIASGASFPWQGPKLASTVHMGPIWFYLLSLPALVFDSWAPIAFMVFLLSGLKFYLAYYLGRQLHSRRLGLMFAVFLALPGWCSWQMLFWTHTCVLETALLIYLIALRSAVSRPTAGAWLLAGLAYGFALHAHPTALPFVFLLGLGWSVMRARWTWLLWWGAGFLLLFLPYLLGQIVTGFPDIAALHLYRAQEFVPAGGWAPFRLLFSVVVTGPLLVYRTAFPHAVANVAVTVHWLLLFSLLIGAAWRWRDTDAALRRLLVLGFAMFLLVILVTVAVRARTPWHMAYAPGFVLAFCYGVLATIALRFERHSPRAFPVSLVVMVLLLGVITGNTYKMYTATIRFQEQVLFDVKNLTGPWGPSGLEIPALWSGAVGRFLCSQEPLVLHGPYAAVIDAHAGMEAVLACNRTDQILIAGRAPDAGYRHWVGVSIAMRRVLRHPALERIGNIYLYHPLQVADTGLAIPLPKADRNPPRPVSPPGTVALHHIELNWHGASALLLSKPARAFINLAVERVECNGQPAQLLLESNYSQLYGCRRDGGIARQEWRASYRSGSTERLDAVLLPMTGDDLVRPPRRRG